MSLSDVAKSISIVWEVQPTDGSNLTRFVYNEHSGLDHSAATHVFYGAEPRNEVAAQFDPKTGRITVGRFDFSVVDKGETVSAWLSEQDAVLAKATVRRLVGLYGEAEATYAETFWSLEDYKVSTAGGGGYQFSCDNVLKQMSVSMFDDQDGQGKLNADLTDVATTITFDDVPSASWPTTGTNFALLYDTGTRDMELITYTGVSGSDLTGVDRAKYGVGGTTTTGTAFAAATCEVYHVWVMRDNPVNLMLKLLTTTDAAGASTPAEMLLNSSFDDWTTGDLDDWTDSPGIPANGTITEGTGDGIENSYLKLTRTDTSGTLEVFQTIADGVEPGKWAFITVMARASEAGSGLLGIRLYNVATTDSLQADGTWGLSNYVHTFDLTTDWQRCTVVFQFDSGDADTDDLRVTIGHTNTSELTELHVDGTTTTGVLVYPFDSEPNGPWDAGDGKGVGDSVPASLINFTDIEAAKFQLTGDAVFDGNDEELTSGTAVLFVEKNPIDDMKRFIEDHLLRPFGFKPLIDSNERFTIGLYFDVDQEEVEIVDKWMKKGFSASKWKRNFSNKLNNVRVLGDWDPIKGEHSFAESVTQAVSVTRYGKAKKLEIPGRGCRTGLNGFPDYGSRTDLLDGIGRIFLETANPFSQIEVDVFYEFRDTSLKDTIRISIPTILDVAGGVRGVTEKPFFVDKKIVDNQQGKVKLTLRERRAISRPAFILPAASTADYSSATQADKDNGCYLTFRNSGKFDNGDPAYTVIGST